jgi:hypothetical protein
MRKITFFLLLIISSINVFAQGNISLSFEINDINNAGFWINASPQNTWQIGSPHKPFFDTAYSKPRCIVTDTVGSYPINNRSSFTLLLLNNGCTNCFIGQPYLEFTHKFDTDTAKDGGIVEVSYNAGTTWKNILLDSIVNHAHTNGSVAQGTNFYTINDTLQDGTPAFTGKSNGWLLSSYKFSGCAYDFSVDSIMVRFTFKSDSINNPHEGWMIDNIYFGTLVCESVPEIQNDNLISVYPNPASNQLTVHCVKRSDKQIIQIFSYTGQLLYNNQNFTGETIDTKQLQNGIYLLKYSDTKNFSIKKFIINH